MDTYFLLLLPVIACGFLFINGFVTIRKTLEANRVETYEGVFQMGYMQDFDNAMRLARETDNPVIKRAIYRSIIQIVLSIVCVVPLGIIAVLFGK